MHCCFPLIGGITLALLFPKIAVAGVIAVPADYATIQAAIVASFSGDTIEVSPGTYTESLDFLGKAILVYSTNGPLATVITNSADSNLVVFTNGEDENSVLEGFTLQGGRIGVLCEHAGPTIRRNILRDQNINNWGAISLGGNGYATNGVSPAIIENNTIVNCANGAISTFSTALPVIRNNILAFNNHYAIHRNADSPTYPHPLMEYNCVFGNGVTYQNIAPGTGVIEDDPLFNPNYCLQVSSPCIDAGDPDSAFNDPDGSRNDMGAAFPSDVDSDGDFAIDCDDNCPLIYNESQLDSDSDGKGDACDECTLVAGECTPCCDLPGDSNGNKELNISDALFIVKFLFQDGLTPICHDRADSDSSNEVTLADAIHLVNWIFKNGAAPECGHTGI